MKEWRLTWMQSSHVGPAEDDFAMVQKESHLSNEVEATEVAERLSVNAALSDDIDTVMLECREVSNWEVVQIVLPPEAVAQIEEARRAPEVSDEGDVVFEPPPLPESFEVEVEATDAITVEVEQVPPVMPKAEAPTEEQMAEVEQVPPVMPKVDEVDESVIVLDDD